MAIARHFAALLSLVQFSSSVGHEPLREAIEGWRPSTSAARGRTWGPSPRHLLERAAPRAPWEAVEGRRPVPSIANSVNFKALSSGNESSALRRLPGRRAASTATESAECPGFNRKASEDWVHVAYTSNEYQWEGVKASLASVVASSEQPAKLIVHILIQRKKVAAFRKEFNFTSNCNSAVTKSGALVRVHPLMGASVEKMRAVIPNYSEAKANNSGKVFKAQMFGTVENYARFFMDLVIGNATVVYLDADTIVQKDVRNIWQELRESTKTVGFVQRPRLGANLENIVLFPSRCNVQPRRGLSDLKKMPNYNAGVFAMNLRRWAERRYSDRALELARVNQICPLWEKSGSQALLLVTMFDHAEDEPEDWMAFDSEWNYDGLGYKHFPAKQLEAAAVLHWSGHRKPWLRDAAYAALWTPHRRAYDSLLKG